MDSLDTSNISLPRCSSSHFWILEMESYATLDKALLRHTGANLRPGTRTPSVHRGDWSFGSSSGGVVACLQVDLLSRVIARIPSRMDTKRSTNRGAHGAEFSIHCGSLDTFPRQFSLYHRGRLGVNGNTLDSTVVPAHSFQGYKDLLATLFSHTNLALCASLPGGQHECCVGWDA